MDKKNLLIAFVIVGLVAVDLSARVEFLKGNWFQDNKLYPAAQTIGAAGTVAADACGGIKRITATAARTTSTTDTFTAPATSNSGCAMDVINVGGFAITLDNNANFNSAGAADVVLGASDTVRVASNGSMWFQIGGTGNN